MDMRHWATIPLLCFALAACGGGGGSANLGDDNPPEDDNPPGDDNPPPAEEATEVITGLPEGTGEATITRSGCTAAPGDSTKSGDGSVDWTPSHTIGNVRYGIVTTRQSGAGDDVSLDYMVHEPDAEPKGILVLIAGGQMAVTIEGEGDQVTNSGANFLVRSAHRFAAQGYRVISMDRPSDYTDWANTVEFDQYRNSMKNAVDIAEVVAAENGDNVPVMLVGTGRGTVSAVANSTLATGIVLSTPLTSGAGLYLGSEGMPISRVQRPAHILFHEKEGCPINSAAGARALFNALNDAQVYLGGDQLFGGIRDDVLDDPCGPLDYHGFAGIETCAVGKTTAWMGGLLEAIDANAIGNHRPQGTSQTVVAGEAIKLSGEDADGDVISFAVPYETSTLGGSVSTTPGGDVTYTPPQGVSGSTDKFVFTVHDAKGGIGFGVVSVTLP